MLCSETFVSDDLHLWSSLTFSTLFLVIKYNVVCEYKLHNWYLFHIASDIFRCVGRCLSSTERSFCNLKNYLLPQDKIERILHSVGVHWPSFDLTLAVFQGMIVYWHLRNKNSYFIVDYKHYMPFLSMNLFKHSVLV